MVCIQDELCDDLDGDVPADALPLPVHRHRARPGRGPGLPPGTIPGNKLLKGYGSILRRAVKWLVLLGQAKEIVCQLVVNFFLHPLVLYQVKKKKLPLNT